MSAFALLIFFLQFSVGFLLISYIDQGKKLTRAERYLAIIVLGPTTCSFILLCLLLQLSSWHISLYFLYAILTICSLFSFLRIYKSNLYKQISISFSTSSVKSISFWIMLIILCLYSGVLFGSLLINEQGFIGAISIGWADTAYHLDMIGKLRTSDPFILEHPVVSGQPLNYPFMLNLQTAFYQNVGLDLFSAWHLSSGLYGISLIFLVYLFGKRILKSEVLAALLVAMVFFGGGIGFLVYFSDLYSGWVNGGFDTFSNYILNPPNEYTHLEYRFFPETSSKYGILHNIWWRAPSISFLSHQRAFLPGLSIATLLFIGLIAYRGNKDIWRWAIIWACLPLIHSHSFIACSIVLICWFFYDLKNWRSWFVGGVIGTLLALPQILYLAPVQLSDEFSFLRPWVGWMMCTHHKDWLHCDNNVKGIDTNIIWFWTKNFGIVFWSWLAVVLLFILNKKNNILKRFNQSETILIPSLLLFIIPNLVLLQPWEFDNNKILFYWWIFASIFTIVLAGNLFIKPRIAMIVVVVVIFTSTFAGVIDVVSRINKMPADHKGFNNIKDVRTAEWIKTNTSPNSSFLTSNRSFQFIPMLTGRSIYLGFSSWLWSQGKTELSRDREKNARYFLYTGDNRKMCEDGVDYVLWNKRLISTYPQANKIKVLLSSSVVYSEDGYEILKINCEKN